MILSKTVAHFCVGASIAGIVLNMFFLGVTHVRRVEGFQEVLIFMRNIAVGYILMALSLMAVAPQIVTLGTSTIRIPRGLMENFESEALNGITSLGCGCYLYTIFCFFILFCYRYNVTCKTSTLSTIFSRKNLFVFFLATAVFCLIQSSLLYYSAVDPLYLREKLNRTKDLREDLLLELNALNTNINTQLDKGSATKVNINTAHSVTADEANRQLKESELANQRSTSAGVTGSASTIPFLSVYGTDYQRNPMIFLSLGIYASSAVLAMIGILASSLAVVCKLHETVNYGSETMSGKSKDEQKQLTKILMATAYVPAIIALVPVASFVVSTVRQESIAIQEVLPIAVLPLIPLTFPLITILCVPALRYTAFQIITFHGFKQTKDSGDSDMNGNTAENSRTTMSNMADDLSDAQLKAISNITKK